MTIIMEVNKMNIEEAWENMTQLVGVGIYDSYRQSIDPDQSVDDNGTACYNGYIITVNNIDYHYTAAEMEAFAETW